MPYISDKMDRFFLNKLVYYFLKNFKIHANLNYFLFKLCKDDMKLNGESYGHYKEFIGELELAKFEIIRRQLNPYEDKKIKENGDVE